MRSRQNVHNELPAKDKLFRRFDWIIWVIVSLFSITILWKIIVTPFSIDFSVMITFLLTLFTIGLSLFYYSKVVQTLEAMKQLLNEHELVGNKDETKAVISEVGATRDEMDVVPLEKLYVGEMAIREASDQIEAEEQTLILKEEERKKILDQLLEHAHDEGKKRIYLDQMEKVDHDLLNVRSNLSQLRKRVNQSLSEIFTFESTKHVRDVVEKLTPDFIVKGSFDEINERFQLIQSELSNETIQFLQKNDYIRDGSLNRKGYREIIRMARKIFTFTTE